MNRRHRLTPSANWSFYRDLCDLARVPGYFLLLALFFLWTSQSDLVVARSQWFAFLSAPLDEWLCNAHYGFQQALSSFGFQTEVISPSTKKELIEAGQESLRQRHKESKIPECDT